MNPDCDCFEAGVYYLCCGDSEWYRIMEENKQESDQ